MAASIPIKQNRNSRIRSPFVTVLAWVLILSGGWLSWKTSPSILHWIEFATGLGPSPTPAWMVEPPIPTLLFKVQIYAGNYFLSHSGPWLILTFYAGLGALWMLAGIGLLLGKEWGRVAALCSLLAFLFLLLVNAAALVVIVAGSPLKEFGFLGWGSLSFILVVALIFCWKGVEAFFRLRSRSSSDWKPD